MPSTIYKGDLAEVSFAAETGITLEVGKIDSTAIAHAKSGDISTFTFSSTGAGTTGAFENSTNALRFPKNILVGSQLVLTPGGSSTLNTDDLADTGKVFTIVENNGHLLKVTPALTTGSVTLASGDAIQILPFKTPPMDIANTYHADSNNAALNESCRIDQFLGITTALTLPETKVDLKRYHVVGLGRSVSVQVPGKFVTEGGSFEVAMHTARWLKYCLGQEIVYHDQTGGYATSSTLNGATEAGDFTITLQNASGFDVGDYVYIDDGDSDDVVNLVSEHEPDAAGNEWGAGSSDVPFKGLFDKARKREVRRIVGKYGHVLNLNEPLQFPHDASEDVRKIAYDTGGTQPPNLDATTKILTDPMYHLLYAKSYLPSFCLEVSHRRRDVDSDIGSAYGSSSDSKELTRVYRGCKINDFSLTTDNDAALRLTVNYNSALCYTDTGRLDGATAGSRYNAHRLFDDTGATNDGRKEAGIARGSQKPFMFYNGTIDVAGVRVGMVQNFTLTGQNNIQSIYGINSVGTNQIATTDQVPNLGARNAVKLVEGQTSYEMTMEIVVEDRLFFDKMRIGQEFSDNATNQIVLEFAKTTSGAGTNEKMSIIIDDYYITEAPLQIPEDKGPVKSNLKIMPKSIKVVSRDSIIQY